MYTPNGLQYWEIVAASGLCALGFLSLATLVSAAVAVFVTREPVPVRAPTAAPAATEGAAPQPAFAA